MQMRLARAASIFNSRCCRSRTIDPLTPAFLSLTRRRIDPGTRVPASNDPPGLLSILFSLSLICISSYGRQFYFVCVVPLRFKWRKRVAGKVRSIGAGSITKHELTTEGLEVIGRPGHAKFLAARSAANSSDTGKRAFALSHASLITGAGSFHDSLAYKSLIPSSREGLHLGYKITTN